MVVLYNKFLMIVLIFLGIFLHMASPTVVTCPSNPVSLVSGTNWRTVVQTGMDDPSGEKWNLEYRAQNVGNHTKEDEIWIKLARDVKKEQLFTGGYYRPADFNEGGEYQVRFFIKFCFDLFV